MNSLTMSNSLWFLWQENDHVFQFQMKWHPALSWAELTSQVIHYIKTMIKCRAAQDPVASLGFILKMLDISGFTLWMKPTAWCPPLIIPQWPAFWQTPKWICWRYSQQYSFSICYPPLASYKTAISQYLRQWFSRFPAHSSPTSCSHWPWLSITSEY